MLTSSATTCGGASAKHAAVAATTPLTHVHDLLVSLLHWWPYGPHEQSPSLLLCGPASNGKSHLIRRIIHAANNATSHSVITAQQELVTHERRRRVIAVTPRLAAAVAVQNARDGCTGVRRLLRRSIQEACLAAQCDLVTRSKMGDGEAPSELAVLLVLDHMECYLTHDNSYFSSSDNNKSGTDGNGESADGGLGTQYPALLADLYTILRGAPPLLSQPECAALRLSTLVFVTLFTGKLDEVQPIVRQRYVDYALSLPTPTEAERRNFFQLHIAAFDAPAKAAGLLPADLAEALVFRTGGVSYGGLREIVSLAVDHLLCYQANSSPSPSLPVTATTTTDADASNAEGTAEESRHQAGAAAQRIVNAYQSSGSVTALEYRRSAGYVDVQTTRWDDIAGMAHVKATLRRLVTDPIHHRDVYRRFHVRPSTGVLLYGPPGTGKTMLAKAMATELNASFIYINLPELVQSEVGESERRLQAYFDVARERSPSLMFMDEVQAAFGLRYGGTMARSGGRDGRPRLAGSSSSPTSNADTGTAAGATSTSHDARLVSHLLRLLDAAQQDENHFVLFVGATNVVHLLDPLLLRAGRLDTLLEVPLPDAAARESLVRRVVYGEWAGWFRTTAAVEAPRSATAADEARRVERVRVALVDEFVRLSDGFSGAQVRNFLSVFGLQLARMVTRSSSEAEKMEDAQADRRDGRVEQAAVRGGVSQAHRRLQDAILRFLAGDSDMSGALSAAAVSLVKSSHTKSLG